jgi:hypothetical protein
MAQYTVALASEYNSVRTTAVKVIGSGDGDRRYGYGLTPASSAVSAGQKIQQTHFDNLKADINSAYWYQNGGDGAFASVVSGGKMTWANIVSYQNLASSVDTGALNHQTYFTGGKKGSTPYLTTTNSAGSILDAGWGGAGAVASRRLDTTVVFASDQALRTFFIGGGSFLFRITSSGGSGNKDTSYGYLISAADYTFYDYDRWWANSGSGGANSGSNYIDSYDTQTITNVINNIGGVYVDSAHSITLSQIVYYNSPGQLVFRTTITDNFANTASGPGYIAPAIGRSTTGFISCTRPNGTTPTGGGQSISVSAPSLTDSGWYAV